MLTLIGRTCFFQLSSRHRNEIWGGGFHRYVCGFCCHFRAAEVLSRKQVFVLTMKHEWVVVGDVLAGGVSFGNVF